MIRDNHGLICEDKEKKSNKKEPTVFMKQYYGTGFYGKEVK